MKPCITVLTLGVTAAADVLAARAINALGAVPVAGATSAGLTTMEAKAGTRAPYAALGTAVGIAGAAVAAGAALEVGTAGKLITRTSGVMVGRALSAAAADGDEIEVFLIPN